MKYDTTPIRAAVAAGKHLETKDAGDALTAITKKFGEHADATLEKLRDTDNAVAGLTEQIADIEQKMARTRFGGQPVMPETWGEQFIKLDGIKEFAADRSRPRRLRMDIKATVTNDGASGGSLHQAHRDSTVLIPKRKPAIRDLLNVISVSTNSVEYASQDTYADAADTVAETAAKPEASMTFSLRSVPTQVIAVWIPASRQVLDDAPQLRDIIDTDLRDDLRLKEELQILSGDGTGTNLHGLIPQSTAFTDPLSLSSPDMIDMIGTAILQSALADLPADGIVMHPSDWMRMRLLKDGDGKYLLGNPQADITPSLFGLPVVTTKAISADKFLVGNFKAAATIYDRWEPRVEISTEHSDFFTRNMVAILAEERLALAVKQPSALTYGDFGNVA